MRETKRLAATAALAVAAAALVGVSAFAEDRPERGTNAWRERGGQIRREGARDARERTQREETRDERRNDDAVRERSRRESGSEIDVRGSRDRSSERSRVERQPRERNNGSYDRNRRGNDGNRNRGGYDTNRNRGGYESNRHSNRGRQPYYAHGRVSRVHPYGGGYRVWIDGARYPFFVPSHHYHRDRFRIGLSIRLGGWYNDAGYYDYYDGRSAGELYGVVESVDYRRNTFVVRNEATGNFVTVVARGREADRLRAGDVVELRGDWSRRGYFEARDVDRVDSYYRR